MKRDLMITMIGRSKIHEYLKEGNSHDDLIDQLIDKLTRTDIEDIIRAMNEQEKELGSK